MIAKIIITNMKQIPAAIVIFGLFFFIPKKESISENIPSNMALNINIVKSIGLFNAILSALEGNNPKEILRNKTTPLKISFPRSLFILFLLQKFVGQFFHY